MALTIRTIKGRIVLAIVLVGCVPLLMGLVLAYMSGMQSLRDLIGGNLQAVAVQAADRVTMLVQSEIQAARLLGSAPLSRASAGRGGQSCLSSGSAQADLIIQERTQIWEKGKEAAARLLDGGLSRFLLDTKVRSGDKVVGLLIVDQHGSLVAPSSEPDHYSFGGESWWNAIRSGGTDHVYVSEMIPTKEGSFRTPEETIDIAVPILDDRHHTVIGAVKASYRFDTLLGMINQIRIGQTGHAMLFKPPGSRWSVRSFLGKPIGYPAN